MYLEHHAIGKPTYQWKATIFFCAKHLTFNNTVALYHGCMQNHVTFSGAQIPLLSLYLQDSALSLLFIDMCECHLTFNDSTFFPKLPFANIILLCQSLIASFENKTFSRFHCESHITLNGTVVSLLVSDAQVSYKALKDTMFSVLPIIRCSSIIIPENQTSATY